MNGFVSSLKNREMLYGGFWHSMNCADFQVCEVYKLHRETFYLGQDYFDRFMATQDDVLKTTLQLVGISCLFIAAKMEVCFTCR